MVLQNYVILQEGVPARMHFVDHEITSREITDPLTNKPKTVKALVLTVDELNGTPIHGFYSTISEKHAVQFSPYLEGKTYREKVITITQMGKGFSRDWLVKVESRR